MNLTKFFKVPNLLDLIHLTLPSFTQFTPLAEYKFHHNFHDTLNQVCFK